jgi:tellurite resistance protein
MTQPPKIERRPKAYPPPEFPPRRPKLFAKTPPAVFPVVLGLLGLGLALRRAADVTGLPGAVAELVLGLVLGLWAFATAALLIKIARRPGVVLEDLKVLPGRAGLAAASMSGMAAAGVLVPYAPGMALVLAVVAVLAHAVLAVLLGIVLLRGPKEARGVNPTWHLSFVGFIVAAGPLVYLGHADWAQVILWATMVAAAAIWGLSLAQLIGRIPPAPLRPLLAIHLSPAALFCTVALALGQMQLATSFALFGAVIVLALVAASRWITAAGFSPLWGSFTFPMAAFASAMIAMGGVWQKAGFVWLVIAALAIPMIAWRVLKMWPGGKLAGKTNAAEA